MLVERRPPDKQCGYASALPSVAYRFYPRKSRTPLLGSCADNLDASWAGKPHEDLVAPAHVSPHQRMIVKPLWKGNV
jgi:hypothetical protein